MNKHLAPVLGAVAVLGVVGGVAGAQFLGHSAPKPAVVHLMQQAAQVVTPSPTTTTVAPAPSATATPVKVVKAATTAAPVHSVQAVAPAPAPVQKAAAVSTDTSTSSPAPAPIPGEIAPPLDNHSMPSDSTPGPTGVFGGGAPEPSTTTAAPLH